MVKGITGITKKSAKRYHFFYICIVIGLMESWFFPWDFFLKKVYGRWYFDYLIRTLVIEEKRYLWASSPWYWWYFGHRLHPEKGISSLFGIYLRVPSLGINDPSIPPLPPCSKIIRWSRPLAPQRASGSARLRLSAPKILSTSAPCSIAPQRLRISASQHIIIIAHNDISTYGA